jgi:hypothetical protein
MPEHGFFIGVGLPGEPVGDFSDRVNQGRIFFLGISGEIV